ETFNVSKENKWTTAENVQHLVTATKMTQMAFRLPKFLHVLIYGKQHRASKTYARVVDDYRKHLSEGAKATGVYVPKKTDYQKEKLNNKLVTEGNKLVKFINDKWTEQQLDKYVVVHPILGILTLRELAYFTIYHNL